MLMDSEVLDYIFIVLFFSFLVRFFSHCIFFVIIKNHIHLTLLITTYMKWI